MSRRSRLLVALTAGLLLVAACSSDDDDGAAGPTTTVESDDASTSTTSEAVVDALDTSALGPYSVGRRTVTITDPDRDDRSLTTDIWYPTDVSEGDASTYSFAPGIGYDSDLALDAPPISVDGPFPLVVYSHGSGGLRYVASYFTETLASHGVVVVAPDHAGNTTLDQFLDASDPADVIAANRPVDVSVVITALLDGSADSEITDVVDAGRVAVTGHSFGGYTALAAGGGVAGLEIAADDRVDAVIAFAPAAGLLADEDLAAIDIPTMVVSGTLDTSTPIDPNTERTASLVAGRPLYRVDLVGATHQSFSDVCFYTEVLREIPDISADILDLVDTQADNTCGPDVLDVDEAQDLTNRYAIAFLLAELTGSDAARAVLDEADAPDVVDFSEI